MDSITFIGLAGGTLTTAAFVPQVMKVWRTRSTRDISMLTFLALFVGTVLWLTYGLLSDDIPLIAANAVTIVLIAAVLVAKFRFR